MPQQDILKTQNNMLQVYEQSKENCKKNEHIVQIRYWQGMQLFPVAQNVQWEQNLIVVEKQKELPKKGMTNLLEIYDSQGIKMATIQKGIVAFEPQYFMQLQEYCRNAPQFMNMLSLDTNKLEWDPIMGQNKGKPNLLLPATELEKISHRAPKKELVKEEIAKRKQIPLSQIYIVREDANLYEDHPILKKEEENLFFYRNENGVVQAEYYDEKTGQMKPSKYIKPSTTDIRKEVSIGKDGKKVEREVPYQTMYTQGLNRDNTHVRDIRFSVNIHWGELEINESRQGTNGEWSSHEVEMEGKDYNTKKVEELTQNRTKSSNPDKISESFEKVEDTGLKEDGIQIEEMTEPEKVIQKFIDEGYQRKEAIQILNYMIGEEKLTEKQAKERVNEEIELREKEEIENIERPIEDSHSQDYEERSLFENKNPHLS